METMVTLEVPKSGYRGHRRRTDSCDSSYSSDSCISSTDSCTVSTDKATISVDRVKTADSPKQCADRALQLCQTQTAQLHDGRGQNTSEGARCGCCGGKGSSCNTTVDTTRGGGHSHGKRQNGSDSSSCECYRGKDSTCTPKADTLRDGQSHHEMVQTTAEAPTCECGYSGQDSTSSSTPDSGVICSSDDESSQCNWRNFYLRESQDGHIDLDRCDDRMSPDASRQLLAGLDLGPQLDAWGGSRVPVWDLRQAEQPKNNMDSFMNSFQRTIQDPGTQRLTWYKPPLSVLIIKKIFDDLVITPFIELATWLVEKRHMLVFIEKKTFDDSQLKKNSAFLQVKHKLHSFREGEDDLTDKIDFIICLGGDGTLLYASSLFQESVPPVMAFHLGSLGFLGPFDFSNFREKVTQVLEGNAALTLRTRLKCVVNKSGTVCSSVDGPDACSIKNVESKQHILVLNEVVVDRGPSPYICNIDLFIEHKYITSVQGDGLIISTPTGSTAYAAAAGASMIHPNVPAILIAPVCPHSLSFRPIVVPAGVEIKIMISPEARSGAWVSFDGRQRQELFKGDVLRISTSIYPVPSICSQDQISDWFESLAGCLHWNVRKQQRAFMYNGTSAESLDSASDNSNGK